MPRHHLLHRLHPDLLYGQVEGWQRSPQKVFFFTFIAISILVQEYKYIYMIGRKRRLNLSSYALHPFIPCDQLVTHLRMYIGKIPRNYLFSIRHSFNYLVHPISRISFLNPFLLLTCPIALGSLIHSIHNITL